MTLNSLWPQELALLSSCVLLDAWMNSDRNLWVDRPSSFLGLGELFSTVGSVLNGKQCCPMQTRQL